MAQNWETESACSVDEMSVHGITVEEKDLDDGEEEYNPIAHPYEKQSPGSPDYGKDEFQDDLAFENDESSIETLEPQNIPSTYLSTLTEIIRKITESSAAINGIFHTYEDGIEKLKQEMLDHSERLKAKMNEMEAEKKRYNERYEQLFQ
ncbi:hypothetical protein HK103_007241 [Boothiomyces macroporosus]|uniref:Uncharacterized protein n=1 Tax=Boothiomyces macroporosus TaxID=261099 RepID=A0AAD5UCE5_9FUNG|nr:hypothetical protein HK103_007241 [Boothiomyces macroporosus]